MWSDNFFIQKVRNGLESLKEDAPMWKYVSQLKHAFPSGCAMNEWQGEEVLQWNDLAESHTGGQ